MADEVNVGMWVGIAIAILVVIILLLWFLRWCSQGTQFKSNVKIDGKVVIVTGSNTGIGKETVLDLAARGAKIYMACRDSKKCEAARQEIISKTGNNEIYNYELDLSSFDSIRNFVKKFLEKESKLDILINNAGVMAMPKRLLTKDGFEMQFGVNHMGHFLLTILLLDILKASAPSRIVVVSSIGHYWGRIHMNDINSEKSYGKWSAYFQSKLANVLFTRELAKRLQGTGVTVNVLHPGAVNTELARHQSGQIFWSPMKFFMKTPKAGAQTTLAVALDPQLDNITGKYFDNCKIKEESRKGQDDEMAKWLWETSEKLVEEKTV